MTWGEWLSRPFVATRDMVLWFINLNRTQMRNVFSLFMLAGILALSTTNWVYMGLAKSASQKNDLIWLGVVIEQTRFNSILIGFFAFIVGGIAFGADYLRAKHGDTELALGKGKDG